MMWIQLTVFTTVSYWWCRLVLKKWSKLVPVGGAPSDDRLFKQNLSKSSPLTHLTLTERWDSCVWGVRQPVEPWLLFIGSFCCCQVRRLLTWRGAAGQSWQVILKVRRAALGCLNTDEEKVKKISRQLWASSVCVLKKETQSKTSKTQNPKLLECENSQ